MSADSIDGEYSDVTLEDLVDDAPASAAIPVAAGLRIGLSAATVDALRAWRYVRIKSDATDDDMTFTLITVS